MVGNIIILAPSHLQRKKKKEGKCKMGSQNGIIGVEKEVTF